MVNHIFVVQSPHQYCTHQSGRRGTTPRYGVVSELMTHLGVDTLSQQSIIGRIGQVGLDFNWPRYLAETLALDPVNISTIVDMIHTIESSPNAFS